MTYNDTYQRNKNCGIDRNLAKCKQKHPKPKEILLECGEGTGRRTFTSSEASPFQLAFVNLDTTLLDKSKVLIKFSSIINMRRLIDGATVRLKYELFKVDNNEKPKSLGLWIFEEIDVITNSFEVQEESFSFIFCDSITSPKSSQYFVAVTPIEINGAAATVSNGRMAALSQPLFKCYEDEDGMSGLKYKDIKFEKNNSKPKKIVHACGQGNGSVTLRDVAEVQSPFDIAHVVLDTTTLIKPKVLIEFSTTIKLDDGSRDIRLQFELFRVCEARGAVSLGTWRFERTGVITNVELVKAFDFILCDSEAPSSCCEYFVMVTPIEINISGIFSDILVDNARMVALGQSSGDLDEYIEIDRKYECTDCVQKSPRAKKILFECGEGAGSRTFRSSNEPAFQLAQVTIDTSCLCTPIVNIEFSSILSFDRLVTDWKARLRYELFRACENKEPVSIGVWTSERVISSGDDPGKSTNIFNFTFCDCITCPGCCDYFVKVTPIEITEGIITATVDNGRMAVFAQEAYCNQDFIVNNPYKSCMDNTECRINSTEINKLFLECGEGNGIKTFTSSDDEPFQIAHVTLNNPCLNKSEVLIKFSSIVNIESVAAGGATVRLQYELFRACDGGEVILLGNWIFEEVNFSSLSFDRQEESFSFIFCDRITCKGCCDYFVRVTPIEITGAESTVSNGRMAALLNPLWGSLQDKHRDSYLKKGISLLCGRGNGSIFFRSDLTSDIDLDPPTNIAHVTIDTRHLVKPKALIEFSSSIKVGNRVRDIGLQFELFRACGGGEPLCLGTWNFERIGVDDSLELDQSFDFIFCEEKVPKGCCEYFVKVTLIEIEVTSNTAEVVVDNVRMVALVQSSRVLGDCKGFDTKNDGIGYLEQYPIGKKIIFECGEGTGSRTFRSINEPAFQIAQVAIDTSTLCNPIVNIEFSSIVSFEGRGGSGSLRYELFRACDNREVISLGIWVSEVIGISTFDRTTSSFNFTFCDCVSCPSCCDYFVKVTPVFISNLTAMVSNGRIAAVAQEA